MLMMNVREIDLADLPSLPLEERAELPHIHAVYFVVSSSGEVLYVGQTSDLYRRWQAHHRFRQSLQAGATRLVWIAVDDPSELYESEEIAIEHFRPLWNGARIPDHIGPEQTNIRLDEQAKQDAREIARRYNLNGTSAAIRLALRELARQIKQEESG